MAAKRGKRGQTPKSAAEMPLVSLNIRNLLIVTLVIGALALLFVAIGPQGISPALGMGDPISSSSIHLKNLNLKATALPVANFKGGENAPGVSVKTDNVNIKGASIFYRSADPADGVSPTGQVLFLLHGAAFTSKTWQAEIGTIQTFASLGHKVFAVDLPGYGQSGGYTGDKGEFLELLIKALTPGVRPVLVSPSMSGSFSLPLLDRNQDLLCGYIPVAPVGTSSYQRAFFEAIHIPTLIVYGDKDTGLGVTSANHLQDIPTSTSPQILTNARHPAYLDQPEDWHLIIYNFMLHLKC